ncbi:hypothetical protein LBMAG53_03730 [Planctomycetota bacterium]|nr:hypothetical protein LBMAG53_03730 [Planctomycetota bacterium]
MSRSAHPFLAPLLRAVVNDRQVAERLLADNPHLVQLRDGRGQTALHLLAQRGEANAVVFLIERGAEVDPRNDFGSTALIDAAKAGHLDVVQILADHGANLSARERSGDTALAGAALCGQTNVVEELLIRLADRPEGDLNPHFDDFSAAAVACCNQPITGLLARRGLRSLALAA